ncbi:MAG: hypothetical protein GY822_26560 [Deltaproteobacteria bacterium]|nr:hypothetical protein [Deltaproteobacteria bacterium]
MTIFSSSLRPVVFGARLAIVGLLFGSISCVTPRPALLPPLVEGEGDVELQRAHADANKAYAHCRELSDVNSITWHSIAAGGALFSGVIVVAGGASTAFLFQEDPLIFPIGVGVAASSTAFFAISAMSAWSIPDDFHRGRIRDASLVQGRQETMQALDARDAQSLLRVKRNLYENCRAADLAVDGEAGDVLLRDYSRYRREAAELRRWHDELKGDLQKQNEEQKQFLEESKAKEKVSEEKIRALQSQKKPEIPANLTTSTGEEDERDVKK